MTIIEDNSQYQIIRRESKAGHTDEMVPKPGSVFEAHRQQELNRATIEDQARAALAANRAFLATAKPGTAAAQASQAYDQTRALTRQMNGVLRLLLGQLDGTD